jgi:hypothetical protein
MNAIAGLVGYPNPTDGILNIYYKSYNSYNSYLAVFDAVGRLVFEKDDRKFKNVRNDRNLSESAEMTIDISHLQNGIYYLKIGEEVKKIVKK